MTTTEVIVTEPGLYPDMPEDVYHVSVGRHHVALIDIADLRLVAPFHWHALRRHNGKVYACAHYGGQTVYMHRLVTSAPKGMEVDHRNGDGLDNRRSNLRVATPSQNSANAGKPRRPDGSRTSSHYKGVTWDRSRGRWQAKITVLGKCRNLGRFDDEAEAARAYDMAAAEAWGEFAVPNFPAVTG